MVLLGLDYAPSFIKKIAFSIIDKHLSPAFPIHTKNTDIRCMKDLRASIDPDSVIVNLAAKHRDDVMPKNLYDDVNVQGARIICTIANERGLSKIIFTSSVAVYGFAPLGTNEGGFRRLMIMGEQSGKPSKSIRVGRQKTLVKEL